MFIVNQDGDLCVKLETVSYGIDWDNETKKELDDIYDNIRPKAYYYGSTVNCLKEIEIEQNNYIRKHNCKKVLKIYINGKVFAIYDTETGVSTFKNIIDGLKNNIKLIDLSQKRIKGETEL